MRTYVICDVDGVINVTTRGSTNWTQRWGWGPEHGAEKVLIGNENEIKPMNLRWSPELISRLNILSKRPGVDFIWLTTWEQLAPAHLQQVMGLDCEDWPVLGNEEYVLDSYSSMEHAPGREWWKLTAIRNWYADQMVEDEDFRFVWLDDNLRRHGCLLWTASLPRNRVLTINPVSMFGINPEQMETIERWIG